MNIGSDEVHLEGERVVVQAAHPMDWPVREFCRVPIWFEGRKYYLRTKREGQQPHPQIYELWPWSSDWHSASTREVVYDEAYVIERDRLAVGARRSDRVHLVLLPLYPVLGLCWSGFKHRVLGPLGFEPRSLTRVSVALTFNLFVVEGVFVGWLGGGLLTSFLDQPILQPLDWAILLFLGTDSVMRYGQSLNSDVANHWGIGEWLWPRRR